MDIVYPSPTEMREVYIDEYEAQAGADLPIFATHEAPSPRAGLGGEDFPALG